MTTGPIPEGLEGGAPMQRQHDCSPAPSGSGACCPRVNLFRHKLLDDLLCAIREDYPVPAFIDGTRWTFAGAVNEAAYGLVERNWDGAKDGVRLLGFYIFQSCPVQRPVDSSSDDVSARSGNFEPPAKNRNRLGKAHLARISHSGEVHRGSE